MKKNSLGTEILVKKMSVRATPKGFAPSPVKQPFLCGLG